MPSIEILCVGQQRPTDCGYLPFAVDVDFTRQSHRSHPLFQADFDASPGILYHLGNPSLKADSQGRCFFAYELLSGASQESCSFLEFDPDSRDSVSALLTELLRESPAGQLLFTSDWQFGPDEAVRGSTTDLNGFWNLHSSRQLRFNALYPVVTACR